MNEQQGAAPSPNPEVEPTAAQLENFDDLFYGDPVEIEQRLGALVPLAKDRGDRSLQAQILSQLALAQAMQKKFEQAHATLDQAAALIPEGDLLAATRVTLERGRVHHQAGDSSAALPHFRQAYELALHGDQPAQTINAAHMIAIVVDSPDEKIDWNARALKLAQQSSDPKARAWLGPLYNNLARSQIDAGDFEGALLSYTACQTIAEERNETLIVRGALWGRALANRLLGKYELARRFQLQLLEEYAGVEERGELPAALLATARGMVYAELAELDCSAAERNPQAADSAREYARLAYQDLHTNEWFQRLESKQLERLRRLAAGDST